LNLKIFLLLKIVKKKKQKSKRENKKRKTKTIKKVGGLGQPKHLTGGLRRLVCADQIGP
jgi:hypothetical protein